jgi:hypothetical protein
VCDELGAFHELANKRKFANIWEGYSDYIRAVQQAGPSRLTLRDKDRWLTARLAYHDLMTKVAQGFESEKGEGKREKAPPHHSSPHRAGRRTGEPADSEKVPSRHGANHG